MDELKPGARVAVRDPALDKIRAIFKEATGDDQPNNVGTIEAVRTDDVLINFDDGGCAPYPTEDVFLLVAPDGA